MSIGWNPWHGCKKFSTGCEHCYVYRQDEMYGAKNSSEVRKNTAQFDLPLKLNRNKSYKIQSGQMVYTCFTSDFFVEEADEWRIQAWKMMKIRKDLRFFFFTKRVDRFSVSLPDDWGGGYENVIIGCSVENQETADYRLPIFEKLPIRHKLIIVAPMLEKMDISPYLNEKISEVSVSGESGKDGRIFDYDWALDIRRQCVEKEVSFEFHQTGAKFLKDGKLYRIRRCHQLSQAQKAGIDYKLDCDLWEDFDEETPKLF